MLAAVLTTAVFLSSAPGAPQVSEAEQERFKTFVLTGEKYFGEGDFGMAIWAFRQADEIRVTPEVAYNLAKAHEKIEDWGGASYYYRLYLRRAPDAPDALEVAESLGEMLARAEAEGRGLVEVDAPTAASATLGGNHWVQLPIATFLPPGDYALEVKFANGATEKRTVSVLTGRTTSLRLESVAPPLLNADGTVAAVSVADGGGISGRKVLHYSSMAIMGASALAILAGTAYGAMSAGEAARLGTERQSLTVSEAQGVARSAGEKGATANLLWVAGGVGLAAGGAMFVFTLPEPGVEQ